MGNGEAAKFPLKSVYQAAVVLLLLLASFIGARIYSKVDDLPEKYVMVRQYDCDTKELKDAIKDLGRKIDRIIFKQNERGE